MSQFENERANPSDPSLTMTRTAQLCDVQRTVSPRPPGDGQEQIQSMSESTGCRPKTFKSDLAAMFRLKSGKMASETCTDLNKSEFFDNSHTDLNPSVPSYCKWAQNLNYLLKDPDGMYLFQQYLKQEGHDTSNLDFWCACEGFRKRQPHELRRIMKLIYRRFIRSHTCDISSEISRSIADKMASKQGLDCSIFDAAQREIETVLTKTTYPNFLRSDIYVQHVCQMQDSGEARILPERIENDNSLIEDTPEFYKTKFAKEEPRENNNDLPTVYEDDELQLKVNLSKEAVKEFRYNFAQMMAKQKPESQAGLYLKSSGASNNSCYAKYASYLPPSTHESELHSMSSDAQTDDTMSLTDQSIVGPEPCSKDKCRKYKKPSKYQGELNVEHMSQSIIPRTQVPQSALLAQNPEQFFAVLVPKLQKVLEERENRAKLNEKLEKADTQEDNQCAMASSSSKSILPQNKAASGPVFTFPQFETAQSILDDHVSRVFNWDSAHQTPLRSPSCITPPAQPHMDATRNRPHSSHMNSGHSFSSCRSSKPGQSHDMCKNKRCRDCSHDQAIAHDPSSDFEPSILCHNTHTQSPYNHSYGFRPRDSAVCSTSRTLYTVNSSSTIFDSGVSVAGSTSIVSCQKNRKYNSATPTYGFPRSGYNDNPLAAQETSHQSFTKMLHASGGQFRNADGPRQSFAQDCNMIDTTSQLMETCRRLEEENRNKMKTIKKSARKSMPNAQCSSNEPVVPVAYTFEGDGSLPYLSRLSGKSITLKQFKQSVISKKGNFRYFFKRTTEDFGLVLEEVTEDNAVLPLWEGKIFCNIVQQVE